MKKYFYIVCVLSMLVGFTGCGSSKNASHTSESESIIEETTATTTKKKKTTTTKSKTTTKKETETTTKANREPFELTDLQKIGEVEFYIPSNYKVSENSIDVFDENYIYTYEDISVIQVGTKNFKDDLDFSEFDDYAKKAILDGYAEGFINSGKHSENSKSEETKINEHYAIKQEATISIMDDMQDYSVIYYHFEHDNNIYTFGFCGLPTSSVFSFMEDVIDSIKFKEIKNESNTVSTEPKTEKHAPESNGTLGQKNALKSAESYVDLMDFSYLKLIDQLEYEGYSHEEAVYGADNCGANWNAEALDAAKSYLDIFDYSYQGLYNQLTSEYGEQFTASEAQYAVDNCGADWYAEAAECAKGYIDSMPFSREELLNQLLYEGFTQEQAEYGVQSVGY